MKNIVVVIFFLFAALDLYAEDSALTLNNQIKQDEKLSEGWHPKLGLGLDLSFSSSSSVVGQEDGDTLTIGGKVDSGVTLKRNRSEWRQQLKLTGKTAKTPTLPRFVKSADELKYESLYLYSLESNPKLGPYFRVAAEAPVFFW